MKKVFISQSNYIPWKGYFDAINSVDEFIIIDNVQYTKNDWRNRNKINTPSGPIWLSIPVQTKGFFPQNINQTKVCNNLWAKKHWKSIFLNYARSSNFKEYAPIFEELYLSNNEKYLSKINYKFITQLCSLMQIDTKISQSDSYSWEGKDKTERIINLCKQAKATHYLTGPSAKNYLNETLFKQEKIVLEYISYPPNETINVSIIDYLFRTESGFQQEKQRKLISAEY